MDDIFFPESFQALRDGIGTGIKVAIIDSGVENRHPDLGGLELTDDLAFSLNSYGQIETIDGEGRDVFGHGTAIAGIIRRMAPEAKIGSFRVMNANLGSKVAMISSAVREAISRGYTILNCSFGCPDHQNRHMGTFKELVDLAYLRGVHVVAACNNENFESVEWPGHFPTVLTCNMGIQKTDTLYYKSGSLVEFSARGVDEILPWMGGARKKVRGSSYAAPVISGYLARLLSIRPEIDPLLAKCILKRFAEPYQDDVAGPNVLTPASG